MKVVTETKGFSGDTYGVEHILYPEDMVGWVWAIEGDKFRGEFALEWRPTGEKPVVLGVSVDGVLDLRKGLDGLPFKPVNESMMGIPLHALRHVVIVWKSPGRERTLLGKAHFIVRMINILEEPEVPEGWQGTKRLVYPQQYQGQEVQG